jgi:hypothetical protein
MELTRDAVEFHSAGQDSARQEAGRAGASS